MNSARGLVIPLTHQEGIGDRSRASHTGYSLDGIRKQLNLSRYDILNSLKTVCTVHREKSPSGFHMNVDLTFCMCCADSTTTILFKSPPYSLTIGTNEVFIMTSSSKCHVFKFSVEF